MNELCSTLCEPLAQVIDRWTQGISDVSTPVPGLTLFRRERVLPPDYCIIPPSIVVVVQGEKQMLVGDGAFSYDASRYLITSLDLPASSVVVQASPDEPCLGLAVSLDLRTIAELIAHGSVPLPRERAASGSIGIGALTPAILKPIGRLLELLDEPAAGMTGDEVERLIEVIRRINDSAAVIVVDPDMEFVRLLGARVTVFHQGSILVEGSADAVLNDARVREVYLGSRAG